MHNKRVSAVRTKPKFSVRPPHVFSGENDKFVVQGSDVGTKTHFNRDDLTLRDIPSVPDQCRVDLSRNLRSMSNGKNSALGIDAVVNGRAANSFNSETNALEHEPIELFPCKNRFEALSSIDLNEGNDSNVETYLTTTVASQLSSTEKVKIKRDKNGLFILKRTNKPTIILNSNNKVFDALLDTGSDRCLLNYRNLKYVDPCEVKPSSCVIRGVNKESKNNVIGEVDLFFKLKNNATIKTNALIINDGAFQYDMIIGRDVLANSTLDLNAGTIHLHGSTIKFYEKQRAINTNDTRVSDVVWKENKNEHYPKNKLRLNRKALRKGDNDNFDYEVESFKLMYVSQLQENKGSHEGDYKDADLSSKGIMEPMNQVERENKGRKRRHKVYDKTVRPIKVHVRKMTLEGNSMSIVEGRLSRLTPPGEYIVSKSILKENLLIAESLVTVTKGKSIPLLIVNPCDDAVILQDNHMISQIERYDPEGVVKESFVCSLVDSLKKAQSVTNEVVQSFNCSELEKCALGTDGSNVYTQSMKSSDSGVDTLVNEVLLGKNKTGTVAVVNDKFKATECNENNMPVRLLTENDVFCENEVMKGPLIKVLNDYRDVVSLEGEKIRSTKLVEHKIRLKDPQKIVNLPPYRIPHKYRDELENINSKMLKDDIIEPSISPYNSPLICVTKKSGECRPVIDFRTLNNIVPECYPLPRIDEILYGLRGAKIFTSLDLRSAFHQVPLSDESKELTAFTLNFRKYQFKRLPFGLTNSPSVFQAIISNTLASIIGEIAFVFLDDILIFSKTEQKHLEDLTNVLDKLRHASLSLKLEKCEFFKEQINYLGHQINSNGITCVQNDKLKYAAKPTCIKELQSFLGLANFYRKFIPNFAQLAQPLYNLLKKDTPYNWDNLCQNIFESLKQTLTSDVVLAHPDYEKTFHVFTDASNIAVGAVLMQQDKKIKNLRPIAFFSKSLNSTQKRYSTTKKELLGIHLALKEFKYLILGYDIELYTDHKPLTPFFFNRLPQDAAMARWTIDMQPFNCTVKYFAGKKNIVADCLSRLRNEPNLLDIVNKLPKITHIDDEVECHVTTRLQSKFNNTKV